MKISPILSFLFILIYSSLCSQGTQLLRQPTISSDEIVFIYANDLWRVNRDGGDAIRLTSNEGYEFSPHYSPDEKWIAFSAQYGGNTDVYVISSEGGSPERLTWHPSADIVQGWTSDGEVMFRSSRKGRPTQTNKFYSVSLQGGLPKALPVPRAAYGEMSPNGKQLAYVPITFWDPEWRNYRGGQAMPIWILNLKTNELIRTPQPTKERHLDPVWYNNNVFYLSERDMASNIWMFNPKSKVEKQITFHKQFDVKSLDACKDGIVYEMGGYLHLVDPSSGNTKQLEISVKGDMNFARERWESVSANNLINPNISPNGKRAIFEYRGEVFTIPKENGSYRNLTNSSGSAERYPVWSPDGKKIAWFSDESGEYQLQIADQKGLNKKSFALPNPTFYFRPVWSPDGKYLSYTDTDYNVWFVNSQSGDVRKVDTDRYAHPNREMNPVWSPDSKWISYAKQLESHFKAVFAFNIDSGEKFQLTDGMADVLTPVWDKNGKYLYFIASTDYGLNTGWLDMSSYDPSVNRNLYCLLLSKDETSPILEKSDEEEEEEKDKDKEDKNEKKDSLVVSIDIEGIAERIVPLNLPAKNYISLLGGPSNSVFVLESKPGQSGATILKYDLTKLESKEFLTNVSNAVTSYDGSQILYNKSRNWYINSTKATLKGEDGKLSIDIKTKIFPQQEYQQIFKEGWRFMRDFLYVDNVHGAPWDEVFKWYSPWINHVRHRTDLNYVVDILSGEVAIGHSYVSGGDMPSIDFVPGGLLGCDFEESDGYYRIAKIYKGENWNPSLVSPLGQPGLGVKEGDYLLAVNGVSLEVPTNPYSLLEQTRGRTTTLTIGSTTSRQDSKDILVKPVSSENQLRTIDWVEGNRRKVEELSDGKIAYVYVPNTSGSGFTSFNRYYFAQQDKKGVVIDERNNGGGSAADYMIDIMARTPFGYFNSKANDNRPWTTPIAGIWGPKVMIVNERAGSGGDLLPYMFREKGLGPLIGTRTWGGLVGTWDTPRFIDGGRMVAPRGGFFDLDGEWAVEGEGIAPDIEVIQDPKSVINGSDPQLERAVQEALRLLETQEFILKPEPAAPIRWARPKGFKM